jgi:hypothetical protein
MPMSSILLCLWAALRLVYIDEVCKQKRQRYGIHDTAFLTSLLALAILDDAIQEYK